MKIVIELKDKKDAGELLWALEQGGLSVEYGWNPLVRRSPKLAMSKAQKKRTKSVVERVTKQLYPKNIKEIDNKWKFIYDEEIYDSWGLNSVGVISNGKSVLFYRTISSSNGGTEICSIYSSMQCLISGEEAEVSYPWTSDNDDKLLEALNSLHDSSRLCGENSILGEIDFQDYDY